MSKQLNVAGIEALLKKYNKGQPYPMTFARFEEQAERYIDASRHHAIICVIESVARSGMSRSLKFLEMSQSPEGRFGVMQFWTLFKALGYPESRSSSDCFTVHGCGMDMVFATNYDIIHTLCRLGFIDSEECNVLAQRTPHKV